MGIGLAFMAALRLVALGTAPGVARHAPVRNRAPRARTGVLQYPRYVPFQARVAGYPKWSVVRDVCYALPLAPPHVRSLVLRAIAVAEEERRRRRR
jgi:hypothetical protein